MLGRVEFFFWKGRRVLRRRAQPMCTRTLGRVLGRVRERGKGRRVLDRVGRVVKGSRVLGRRAQPMCTLTPRRVLRMVGERGKGTRVLGRVGFCLEG